VALLRFASLALLLPSACVAQSGAPALFGGVLSPNAVIGSVAASSPSLPNAPDLAPGTSQVLTLSEAIAMAKRNSPRLRGAAAANQRAVAATRTAKAYTNPTAEVFEGLQYARPISIPGIPGVLQHYAAYQAIEIPSERRARRRFAELASTSSRYGQEGVLLSVEGDAKHAFYTVLRRREEVEHAKENLKLVEDLRRRVEVEVKVGERGGLELTRAEAEIAHARFAVRSAELELANSIALLRISIAAPADTHLDPRGSLEPTLKLPPLKEIHELVLRTHPAVAQLVSDVKVAEAKLDHERALRIPQPTLFAEFENQPDLRFWRAGVTVPIPLWDHRQGQIAESQAAISETNAVLDQRRLELISATEHAYEQYQLADQQATALEGGELRAAETAVDAAKAAYRFGERGIVEVLDAQRVLQSVRGDLVDAQYQRQSALIDLEELGAIALGGRP
jgi:outer membrane protein, heavy metal efflux system